MRNDVSITVLNLIQRKNLDLLEYLLINYLNLKNYRLFRLQCIRKKAIKQYIYFGNFFFHWLEIGQIAETLSKISKFEIDYQKKNI